MTEENSVKEQKCGCPTGTDVMPGRMGCRSKVLLGGSSTANSAQDIGRSLMSFVFSRGALPEDVCKALRKHSNLEKKKGVMY